MSFRFWIALAVFIFTSVVTTPHQHVDGAKILALLTTACKSHHIWNRSLMLALAARGHHVTTLSPDQEVTLVPNHTDIVIDHSYDHVHDNFDYGQWSDDSSVQQLTKIFQWGTTMCRHGMLSKGTQQLLNSNESFDLIIVEVTSEECFLGFVAKFGAPVMGITAWSHPPWTNYMIDNPDNPSYVTNLLVPLTDHMSFAERLYNTLMYAYTMYYRRVYHMPEMDVIARRHFGDGLTSVSEIERNMTVILVNTHHSLDYPQPLVPGIIPVGGMHIEPLQSLPADLQKYLDEADHGVVYFSLGSNVRSDKMRADKVHAFLQAFSELPQRVLWKWESDSTPGPAENVKFAKWFPQNEILGHPNVLLFITHAGLLSTQEAVYHGVPVIGMPFMLDQHINIQKVISKGAGDRLVYSTLNKKAVLNAIRNVLETPSYHTNMRRLSKIFRDQPQSPLERAVFWTEYVIRHRGAPHLRSASSHLTWFQYFLFDVIIALVAAIVVACGILAFLVKTMGGGYSLLRRHRN